jgi:thymidylate synthase (FAD)
LADMEQFAALAALTCHANTGKDLVPHEVLERIIQRRHESILEHITLTYSIKGLSRACLQELARHRHISLSVESTRHTLKKVMAEPADVEYDNNQDIMLLAFRKIAYENPDMPNDELKYYLPEFWPTNLVLTVNIRELRHILDLRTAPAALKEFRDLGHKLFEAVPEQFRYLLADCVHEETEA